MADTIAPLHPEHDASAPASMTPRRAGRWLWIPALLAGAGIVAASMAVKKSEPESDKPSTDMTVGPNSIAVRPNAPQWKFLKLETVGAVGAHWTDTVPARITIDETLASKVGVPVAGRVTRVMAELGDAVKAGQPLFAVASPEIAELRGNREQSQVELDAARTNLDRVEATVASRALPLKDAQVARQRFRSAEVAAQLADQKLASVRVAPGTDHEFVVHAPRSGVVVAKDVLVNQQVSPEGNASLITVADVSSVWAVADVFEGQTIDIRPGGQAEVTTPSVPGGVFQGKVLMVASVGDPERHTLPVRIHLRNSDLRLRPNIYARVRFSVQQPQATLEIPATALVSDGDKQYVYVQEAEGRFTRRDIVAGSAHEGRVPVISGLKAGDVVVSQGAILLDNQISIVTE